MNARHSANQYYATIQYLHTYIDGLGQKTGSTSLGWESMEWGDGGICEGAKRDAVAPCLLFPTAVLTQIESRLYVSSERRSARDVDVDVWWAGDAMSANNQRRHDGRRYGYGREPECIHGRGRGASTCHQ